MDQPPFKRPVNVQRGASECLNDSLRWYNVDHNLSGYSEYDKKKLTK